MTDKVILVDVNDNEIGEMPKMEAHEKGVLHRAFSIFIFKTNGDLLLQERAEGKYHSAGKWTNTCCSHPRPGEDTLAAANRRLKEEMGMVCDLKHVFSFQYQAEVTEQGLIENEYDHVFFGVSDKVPAFDWDEVAAIRYMEKDVLAYELKTYPDQYSEWLKICFDRVMEHYSRLY